MRTGTDSHALIMGRYCNPVKQLSAPKLRFMNGLHAYLRKKTNVKIYSDANPFAPKSAMTLSRWVRTGCRLVARFLKECICNTP
jgi:hypothetical protein